jgi:hypothetical protein
MHVSKRGVFVSIPLVALAVLAFSGCDAIKGKSGDKSNKKSDTVESSESNDESSDEPKKTKKKKKKKADSDGEPTASASVTAIAGPTVIPTAAPVAGDPLSNKFLGPTTATFLRQKNIKEQPLWVQVLPDWETSRDDASIDYLDGELFLYSPREKHAQIYIASMGKMDGPDLSKLSFDCQRVAVSDCKLDAPVDGKFGVPPGLPAKVAKGTAMKFKSQVEIFYIVADTPKGGSLKILASLKKDVYPKLEQQLIETLKSTKWAQ